MTVSASGDWTRTVLAGFYSQMTSHLPALPQDGILSQK
jgi:hypothetical protein